MEKLRWIPALIWGFFAVGCGSAGSGDSGYLNSIGRYENFYHKLYLFDYTKFEGCPFFSYRIKITTETRQIHEFGMQYDVYTNPDFADIF